MKVWVLFQENRYGNSIEVFRTKEAADASLHQYVKDYWQPSDGDIPDDPDDAIEAYFDLHAESGSESYELSEEEVQE